MSRAFEDLYGVRDAFNGIPFNGRTDAWIVSGAAVRHGVDAAELHRFKPRYLQFLTEELRQPGPRKGLMPGVRPLLDALSARDDVFLALLTGNFADGARIKLEHFDLWKYFRCGAYGDDAADRNALVPFAVTRARERGLPALAPDDVLVVGDTPHDVACAHAAGAVPIAVATGGFTTDDLRAAGAQIVFQDLSDTGAFLDLLGA